MQTLNFFNVTFRVRGDPHSRHEIPIDNISEKEILVLAYMHGADAVRVREFVGPKDVEENQHYIDLANKYRKLVDAGWGRRMVEAALGVTIIDSGENMTRERSPKESAIVQMQRAVVAAGARAKKKEGAEAGDTGEAAPEELTQITAPAVTVDRPKRGGRRSAAH